MMLLLRTYILLPLLLLALGAAANAQPVVAPTPTVTGLSRGENQGEYNITQSFETGYRWLDVNGNSGKYRSDVNFRNGIRLLQGNFTMHSRDGKATLFDEVLLNTQGLGGDPYQLANFRLVKNNLFEYNLLWRENAYYNPALPIASGLHLVDTSRMLQDHDFSLKPIRALRVLLGYSRNRQAGPSLTTANLLGSFGTEAPLFGDVRRSQDEYRVGAELDWQGWRFSGLRGWEVFRDDTERFLSPFSPVAPGEAGVQLSTFRRTEPYHGTTPYWRGVLARTEKNYSVNGSFRYANGVRRFIQDESVIGGLSFGPLARQVLVSGNGRRPLIAGDVSASVSLTSRLTLSAQLGVYRVRMEGNNFYQELSSGTLDVSSSAFELLRVRTVSGAANLMYRVTDWLSLRAGYLPATRQIQSVQQVSFFQIPSSVAAQQSNTSHAGIAGVRLQPRKGLTFLFDGEVGRNSQPFYPISDKDYHAFHGRVQYRSKAATLVAYARTNYNFNSVALSSYSSRSRQYAVQGSWALNTRWSLDAGYNKHHLDTVSGIAYFSREQLITGDRSVYLSNLHTGTLGVRTAILPRTELYIGYVRVQDAGDGRVNALVPVNAAGLTASSSTVFRAAQVYPLTYQTPMARISVAMFTKLRFNVGYQWYHYDEQFGAPTLVLSTLPMTQNYRAHTGFTSLTWSF